MDLFEDIKPRYIIIPLLIIVAIVTAWCCYYTVGEQEQAVITTFGRVTGVDSAGLYFKLPFIQRRYIVNTTMERMEIGYATQRDGSSVTIASEGFMITSDLNIVNLDFLLVYRVSDAVNYLYQTDDPVSILRNMALASIRNVVSRYTVDEVMTTEKYKIQTEVKDAIAIMLDEHKIGLQVVNISIQDAAPPTAKVAKAFQEVETAKQNRAEFVNNAEKYRSEQIPLAESRADEIIRKAEAAKKARVSDAQGQISYFSKIFAEYKAFPEVTKMRLLYEAIEKILPEVKVVITDGKVNSVLPIETISALQK